MAGGYTGKLLFVDLTSGQIRTDDSHMADARDLIGGRGLGGKLLWDLLPGGPQLGGAPANFACHAHSLGARAAIEDDPRHPRRQLTQSLQARLAGNLLVQGKGRGAGQDQDVVGGDHAEVPVDRLGGVKEKRRSPCAIEGSRDLPGYKPGLAHACENDPAFGFQDHLNGAVEFRAHPFHEVQYGLCLNLQNLFDLLNHRVAHITIPS